MKSELERYQGEHMPQLLKNLQDCGFRTLFPVQKCTMQLNLCRNAFIQAPCGSGKTLAAFLPFLVQQIPRNVVVIVPNAALQL